ncbi:hypothetical protein M885DRAFT_135078 [Pelagophyceae sp. CCMP2097]|nr:hypothetical protein M885DRAFT_135078 [Pelagophyceae sp. CCMP2097]
MPLFRAPFPRRIHEARSCPECPLVGALARTAHPIRGTTRQQAALAAPAAKEAPKAAAGFPALDFGNVGEKARAEGKARAAARKEGKAFEVPAFLSKGEEVAPTAEANAQIQLQLRADFNLLKSHSEQIVLSGGEKTGPKRRPLRRRLETGRRSTAPLLARLRDARSGSSRGPLADAPRLAGCAATLAGWVFPRGSTDPRRAGRHKTRRDSAREDGTHCDSEPISSQRVEEICPKVGWQPDSIGAKRAAQKAQMEDRKVDRKRNRLTPMEQYQGK